MASTDSEKGKVTPKHSEDQPKPRGSDMSLSSEVNMLSCRKHFQHFFEKCNKIHFNVLIAYWMMAGYLGDVDSVEEAYQKGHKILLKLRDDKKILKSSPEDPDKVLRDESTVDTTCRHHGLCILEKLGFVNLVKLEELGDGVVITDGMLKTFPKTTAEQAPHNTTSTKQSNGSMLLFDGNHLSREVFHLPKKLKYLAYFKPKPNSLKLLPKDRMRQLSVLLLRDCVSLREIDIPLENFKNLTVLELSGLSHVTPTPPNLFLEISKLVQLKCLNLSDLLVTQLPGDFFDKLVELRWVFLRRCSKLVTLPSIKSLKNLEALDLSCSASEKLATAALHNSQIQILDLSCTAMKSIPALKDTPNLTHLFLKDVKVSVLNSLKQISCLRVLDLSGALNVKQANQIAGNKKLEVLDLSRTQIESVDFLSDFIDLRNLKLQECTSLKQLPAMESLTKLEVLDVSGCTSITELPEGLSYLKSLQELDLSGCTCLKKLREGLFDQMSSLLKLDLSGTKINNLPSISNLTSLRELSLRGLELASLQSFASLSNLVELNLNGLKIISPQKFTSDFIQSLQNLQILDLSKTSVATLPDLSGLKRLRKLILGNCQDLVVLPDLQNLTNLETLDLSLPDYSTINNCQEEIETEDRRAYNLPVGNRLRELVLKNRSGVKNLFPLTSHGALETLDLRGVEVENFPFENMAQLKCIWLPGKIDLTGVYLSRMGREPETIVWKGNSPRSLQGRISDCTDIEIAFAIGNKSSMSATADGFFHLRWDSKGSWEAFIHQFSVSLLPEGSNHKRIFLDGDVFILMDERSWARRLLNLELKENVVEIHGFSKLPEGNNIQRALKQAYNVALVRNDFLGGSSKICSTTMKVCCIRRCQNMESVLGGEKSGIIAECLERLVLSDLANLKLIYAGNVSSKMIESLKDIHIDCCPELEKVIIASQVPQNLETLHIQFCDKLQTLFEQNMSLTNLRKLSLSELPKLEGIEADLPKLETLSIAHCPVLKNLDKVIKSASTSLTELCLDTCPGLKHVLPSSPLPEKLQRLKISSCTAVVTLFDNTGSSSSALLNLQALKLWNLPKLNSIGGELSLVSTPDLDHALPESIQQQLKFPPGQQN